MYPANFSTEAKRLFQMLTGATPPDLQYALHDGWYVTGGLLGLSFGEPGTTQSLDVDGVSMQTINRAASRLTNEQGLALLKAHVEHGNDEAVVKAQGIIGDLIGGIIGGIGGGTTPPPGGAGPGTGIGGTIGKLLLPILLAWLTKFIESGGLMDLIKKLIGDVATPTAAAAVQPYSQPEVAPAVPAVLDEAVPHSEPPLTSSDMPGGWPNTPAPEATPPDAPAE